MRQPHGDVVGEVVAIDEFGFDVPDLAGVVELQFALPADPFHDVVAAVGAEGVLVVVPEVAAGIGMAGKPAAEVFAEIRARKNKF